MFSGDRHQSRRGYRSSTFRDIGVPFLTRFSVIAPKQNGTFSGESTPSSSTVKTIPIRPNGSFIIQIIIITTLRARGKNCGEEKTKSSEVAEKLHVSS